jgi:uncharacterized protein YndB with AHSA1/START domain
MGAEQTVTATTVVRAPQERVWELISDTSRYADYVVGTLEVTRTDGPARMGSTYDERNKFIGPLKASSHWEVVEFNAPHSQVHRGEGIPLVSRISIEMQTTPEAGATEVTFTLRYKPALGPLGDVINAVAFKRMVESDHRKTVESFRALAERELVTPAAAAPAGPVA